MKIQCDVCAAEAALVFCCADEAALCDNCDRRVHRANKVAGKHQRFSLLQPNSSAQSPPLCDICQAKRGFLFCMEDRAILCRDCDVPVHSASDLTMRHNRFLLTGVRVSAAGPVVPLPEEEIAGEDSKRGGNITRKANNGSTSTVMSNSNAHFHSSSSISEYLINMLPGWHVDDFLTGDTATNGVPDAGCDFYKMNDVAQLLDQGIGGFAGTEGNCWVSHGGGVGLREVKGGRAKQQRRSEESVTVPQPTNGGDREWDGGGHKRSRISIRYL